MNFFKRADHDRKNNVLRIIDNVFGHIVVIFGIIYRRRGGIFLSSLLHVSAGVAEIIYSLLVIFILDAEKVITCAIEDWHQGNKSQRDV